MNTAMANTEQSPLIASYEVNGQKIQLDPQVVRHYLVRGNGNVTDSEVAFFIHLCKSQGLNPFAQDAYLIKYGNSAPAQTIVSKSAYMQRAFSNPNYLYKEDGIVVLNIKKEVTHKEGCCLYPGEVLVGGWCRVHYIRAGRECKAYREVSMDEYGKGQSSWKSMPSTMINKVAVSQALREAFPLEYSGLYSEEEMVASGAVPPESVPGMAKEPAAKPAAPQQSAPPRVQVFTPAAAAAAENDPPVSRAALKSMFDMAHSVFGREKGNQVLKDILQDLGMNSTSGMRQSVYKEVMEMLEEACDAARSMAEAEAGETGSSEEPITQAS